MDRIRLSGMAAGPSVLTAFTVASAWVGLVGRAAAHEPPFGTGVYASGTQLVMRMSRGLVLRSSERPDYRFLCNEALGVAEYDAASVIVRADHSLLVGTSTGLRHVSADGCMVDALSALAEARVSALVRAPHDSTRVYAATDVGLYESTDEGGSFVQLDGHAFDSLEAPDGAKHLVFATGSLPSAPGQVRAYVARWHSADGLEMQDFALEPHEYRVTLLGSDTEQVVAVARAYLGTRYLDRLLVSRDGARSWRNLLSAPSIAAFAIDPMTGGWLVGTATGLWRTSATGDLPVQLGAVAVSCLFQISSSLYMCDGSGADGGVSVSADGGEHWQAVLRWNQVAGLPVCAPDASAVQLCQAAWEDWARELPPGPELAPDYAGGSAVDLPDSPPARQSADASPARSVRVASRSASGCAAVSGDALASTRHWWWLVVLSIFMRTVQRLRAKRLSMTTITRSVIIGASLVLCQLSACANDSDSSQTASSRSDAGPNAARESTSPLEPNRLQDAAQDVERTDAAQTGNTDRGPAAGRQAHGGAGVMANAGGSGGKPQSAGAGAEPNDAGTPTSEPDGDSGPGSPRVLCTSCGGCEETIKVVSTMHTTNPVTYSDPPPTSGPHNPCWGRWGIHDEPLAAERWVHNLEHGGVVFLYNCPEGCETEVATLKGIASSRSRTILTAYANLPTRFGVVAWGHRLTSDCLDEQSFIEFYENNFGHGPESNANPPNPGCPP